MFEGMFWWHIGFAITATATSYDLDGFGYYKLFFTWPWVLGCFLKSIKTSNDSNDSNDSNKGVKNAN